METEHTPFMRDLETRYKEATGLAHRSAYKIFYGQVRPASILTLGINPGGAPEKLNPDGQYNIDGSIASASATLFENDEHDVLDCDWKENTGLRRILVPYLGDDASRIRTEVVKTNLAFRRSAKKPDIDIDAAINESAPFLMAIMNRVQPTLILLTGVAIAEFTKRYARRQEIIAAPERDPGVKQVVFAASRIVLRQQKREILLVQVAHASQFGWTYDRYDVVGRIRSLSLAKGPSHEKSYPPSGRPADPRQKQFPIIWLYEGESLDERRLRMETGDVQ